MLAFVLMAGAAVAQSLPDNAQEALDRGEALMAEALDTYDAQYPDRPLWRQAFNEGRTAIELAPGHPEPLRFLAVAYSRSNWPGPAVDAWQAFASTGGVMTQEDTELFTAAGNEYAYFAYQAGNRQLAAERYALVTRLAPNDVEAYRWIGRIMLELEMPEQAVAAWRTVLELDPGAEGADYFLELAQAQSRWGVQPANDFYAGIAAYEAGNMQQARNSFAAASARNDSYAAAWAWLGRVNFEQSLYEDAHAAYSRALALEPDNSNYQWFTAESLRLSTPAPTSEDEGAEG
jgi:tetratricopeptide (TPR) repeat protein